MIAIVLGFVGWVFDLGSASEIFGVVIIIMGLAVLVSAILDR
jgi:hypothetical protein